MQLKALVSSSIKWVDGAAWILPSRCCSQTRKHMCEGCLRFLQRNYTGSYIQKLRFHPLVQNQPRGHTNVSGIVLVKARSQIWIGVTSS